MKRVSVIITTYNRDYILGAAIHSAVSQTVKDIEIIVIDDGSTDDTMNVVKQFYDDRIKYFYRQNAGRSSALNKGLLESQGQYVAFLDDDDVWPENYLAKMIESLDANVEYGLAYALFKNYYPDGKVEDGFKEDRYVSGRLTLEYYMKTPCFLPSSTIIRRTCCSNIWFDESLRNYDDQDYFLRLSVRTKYLFVKDTVIKRTITSASLSDVKYNYLPVFVFERFYRYLGGDKFVPHHIYRKKMSEHYRGLGRKHFNEGCRKAAVALYKKAVACHPYRMRNLTGLAKSLLLSEKTDNMPKWQMPDPPPPYIIAFGRRIEAEI